MLKKCDLNEYEILEDNVINVSRRGTNTTKKHKAKRRGWERKDYQSHIEQEKTYRAFRVECPAWKITRPNAKELKTHIQHERGGYIKSFVIAFWVEFCEHKFSVGCGNTPRTRPKQSPKLSIPFSPFFRIQNRHISSLQTSGCPFLQLASPIFEVALERSCSLRKSPLNSCKSDFLPTKLHPNPCINGL